MFQENGAVVTSEETVDVICGLSKDEIFTQITGKSGNLRLCIEKRLLTQTANPSECNEYEIFEPTLDGQEKLPAAEIKEPDLE